MNVRVHIKTYIYLEYTNEYILNCKLNILALLAYFYFIVYFNYILSSFPIGRITHLVKYWW